MSRGGRVPRQRIADIVGMWLATPAIIIEDRKAVEKALELFRDWRLDFADALIGVVNAKAGCTATYSFDEAGVASGIFTEAPAA